MAITIAIPLGITVYELTFLGKDTVIFLGDYPPAVGIAVMIYYALLLLAGIIWVVSQLKSVLLLKNVNKKNELLHLKSQVNPHFFFNTLNNLYGLVDKDPEKSKNLILKLSDLMRYSIYEGEKERVSLASEVAYLKNYIELHKMRYHKSVDIQFNTSIAHENIKIMPLLFIILMENAFKHGVENLRSNAFVHVDLHATKNSIDFNIKNNFDGDIPINNDGIGLKNLRRRLELVYPKNHDLSLSFNNEVFKAQLRLDL